MPPQVQVQPPRGAPPPGAAARGAGRSQRASRTTPPRALGDLADAAADLGPLLVPLAAGVAAAG